MVHETWNMKGKVYLITGANAGIGKRASLQLAQLGAEVIMVLCQRSSRTYLSIWKGRYWS